MKPRKAPPSKKAKRKRTQVDLVAAAAGYTLYTYSDDDFIKAHDMDPVWWGTIIAWRIETTISVDGELETGLAEPITLTGEHTRGDHIRFWGVEFPDGGCWDSYEDVFDSSDEMLKCWKETAEATDKEMAEEAAQEQASE